MSTQATEDLSNYRIRVTPLHSLPTQGDQYLPSIKRNQSLETLTNRSSMTPVSARHDKRKSSTGKKFIEKWVYLLIKKEDRKWMLQEEEGLIHQVMMMKC